METMEDLHMRDEDDSDQCHHRGNGEKWTDLKYIQNAEQKGFGDWLTVRRFAGAKIKSSTLGTKIREEAMHKSGLGSQSGW